MKQEDTISLSQNLEFMIKKIDMISLNQKQ